MSDLEKATADFEAARAAVAQHHAARNADAEPLVARLREAEERLRVAQQTAARAHEYDCRCTPCLLNDVEDARKAEETNGESVRPERASVLQLRLGELARHILAT